uniref:Uncharacterized protein n=1 Tax=Trichobilharzia regenti TaxID=157069 RepID=A0AA85KCQ2_TRIRE|nr:unnamed protein product [Trichobilharzia regenti]
MPTAALIGEMINEPKSLLMHQNCFSRTIHLNSRFLFLSWHPKKCNSVLASPDTICQVVCFLFLEFQTIIIDFTICAFPIDLGFQFHLKLISRSNYWQKLRIIIIRLTGTKARILCNLITAHLRNHTEHCRKLNVFWLQTFTVVAVLQISGTKCYTFSSGIL